MEKRSFKYPTKKLKHYKWILITFSLKFWKYISYGDIFMHNLNKLMNKIMLI